MNTLINFLFYPYESPVSRTCIRKVGIVLLLVGVVLNVSATTLIAIVDMNIIGKLLSNSVAYLSFITLIAGAVMIKISMSPAHRSPTLLYRMRLGIVTFIISGGLIIYIVFFAGLPQHFVAGSVNVFFALIIAVAIINMRLHRKYRRLEIEERKTEIKSPQAISNQLPDYIVPFKGIKTVKRRKALTLFMGIAVLLLYPFMLGHVLHNDFPYLYDIGYCCVPLALLFSNTALYLYTKWKKEEAPTDENGE